jgi:hypothetical protein
VDYALSATIDLQNNSWSVFLDGEPLFQGRTLTTSNSTRDLGSIGVSWWAGRDGDFGDNFIVFDNYRISKTKGVPVITSAGQKQARVGEDFDYQILATDSPDGFDALGLPSGLTCNPTGRISGKPLSPGTSQVTLTANNSVGTGTKLLLLTVEADAVQAPVITSAPIASAKVGAPFSYQISATNAPTSYNAFLPGGGLPSGLSIATDTGLLSGTPAASGNYSIIISATNAAGTSQATLLLVVGEPTPEPTPEPHHSGGVGGGSAATSWGGGGSSEIKRSKKGGQKNSLGPKKKLGGDSKKSFAKKAGKKGGNDSKKSKLKKSKISKKG